MMDNVGNYDDLYQYDHYQDIYYQYDEYQDKNGDENCNFSKVYNSVF